MSLTIPCIETVAEGRKVHAWESTGLHDVDGVLYSTRRCTWCGRAQYKRYGAGGTRGWSVVPS